MAVGKSARLKEKSVRYKPGQSYVCPNGGIKIGEELKFYGDICERCYFFSGFNKQNGTRLLAKGVERS